MEKGRAGSGAQPPEPVGELCCVGGEPAAPGSPRAQSWYQGQPLCVSVLPRQAGPGITG